MRHNLGRLGGSLGRVLLEPTEVRERIRHVCESLAEVSPGIGGRHGQLGNWTDKCAHEIYDAAYAAMTSHSPIDGYVVHSVADEPQVSFVTGQNLDVEVLDSATACLPLTESHSGRKATYRVQAFRRTNDSGSVTRSESIPVVVTQERWAPWSYFTWDLGAGHRRGSRLALRSHLGLSAPFFSEALGIEVRVDGGGDIDVAHPDDSEPTFALGASADLDFVRLAKLGLDALSRPGTTLPSVIEDGMLTAGVGATTERPYALLRIGLGMRLDGGRLLLQFERFIESGPVTNWTLSLSVQLGL